MTTITIGKSGSGADFICDDNPTNQAVIKTALDSVSSDGDIIAAYPGTYVCNLPVGQVIKNNRVTLTSVDKSNPAIFKIPIGIRIPPQDGLPDGGPWYYNQLFNLENFNINNIIIDGNYGYGQAGDGYFGGIAINNSTIENCIVRHIVFDGIRMQSNCIVRNNYLEQVRHDGVLGLLEANYNLVENNHMHYGLPLRNMPSMTGIGNSAIRVYSGHDNIYKNNLATTENSVIGVYNYLIEVHNSNNTNCNNNLYQNNLGLNMREAGIAFMEMGYATQTSASNMAGQNVINNLLVNCIWGIVFSSDKLNANWNNVNIQNNTIIALNTGIYEHGLYGKSTSSPVLIGDINIYNNIIISPYGVTSDLPGRPDLFKLTNNDIYSSTPLGSGVSAGTGLITTNPSLGLDYRVPIGNPAYGLGANIDLVGNYTTPTPLICQFKYNTL